MIVLFRNTSIFTKYYSFTTLGEKMPMWNNRLYSRSMVYASCGLHSNIYHIRTCKMISLTWTSYEIFRNGFSLSWTSVVDCDESKIGRQLSMPRTQWTANLKMKEKEKLGLANCKCHLTPRGSEGKSISKNVWTLTVRAILHNIFHSVHLHVNRNPNLQ